MSRTNLIAGLACCMLLPLVAGCGESSPTQDAASVTSTTATRAATTTTATTTNGSQTATSSGAAAGSPSHSEATGDHRSARAKALAHKAFSSLANAKPANKLPVSQRAHLAVDDIELTSPAIHSQTGTPATFSTGSTCYGADKSPELNWKNVPPGTKELALFIISTTPVNNQLYYDWAITNIDPGLHGMLQGQTPPGATAVTNSTGHTAYTICPPAGKNETYLIALYALPTKLKANPGANPNELHKLVLHTAHHSGLLVGSYQHT